jgi:hypothetical protein
MPRTGSKAPATDTDAPSPHDPALTGVLTAEYGMLMAALGAAWSASIARTSLFLVVLSAAGVALGFAGQSGPETFRAFAIAVLPLVLFRGAATFVRLVQVQRESVVYITGQNRIRHYFAESTPASRPYFVLPIHDDQAAIFRSVGTGMVRRPPRRVALDPTDLPDAGRGPRCAVLKVRPPASGAG